MRRLAGQHGTCSYPKLARRSPPARPSGRWADLGEGDVGLVRTRVGHRNGNQRSAEHRPEQVNEDADTTWMIKVKLKDAGEAAKLLSGADYEKFIAEEGGRIRAALSDSREPGGDGRSQPLYRMSGEISPSIFRALTNSGRRSGAACSTNLKPGDQGIDQRASGIGGRRSRGRPCGLPTKLPALPGECRTARPRRHHGPQASARPNRDHR